MTPLKRPDYICINLQDIPEEIITEYKFRTIATPDGCVDICATCGMYGLLQVGLLENKLFEKRLNKRGCQQSKLVPSL